MGIENKHTNYDLAQMQSLPLVAKERMSIQRLKVWYESWNKYTLVNKVTGRTTYKASVEEPKLTKNQYIDEVESGACYVSFSGGKDSTVLADLTARFCKEYGYKLILLFVNTGLEYPEIQKHVKEFHKYLETKYDMEIELVIKRPEMRFDQVLKEYGYPVISKEVAKTLHDANTARKSGLKNSTAIQKFNGIYKSKNGKTNFFSVEKYKFLLDAPFLSSHKCCDVMKKKPSKSFESERALAPIIGTMAHESKLRRQKWIKNGCNAFNVKRPSSQPLSFWTEQDIYEYIVKYELPIASVYGEILRDPKTDKYYLSGVKRTGCIFCAFGAQCRGDRRFLDLKETHSRQYDYCINGGQYDESGKWIPSKEGLGLGKVLDYIGVKYKEDEPEVKNE